ncbi:IBR domain-containing protein, partial [Haematococcus lacustris]
QPELALRDSVVSLARHRLKLEGAAAFPELQPGGSFEGRAVDLALTRFAFYKCSKCQQPYCGGLKGCGAPEPEPQGGFPPPPAPTGFMQRAANFLAAARGGVGAGFVGRGKERWMGVAGGRGEGKRARG